ncbi:unnamed protein product [Rotaria sp. Silwood2]|nr:unnamed protein product [Rotaria sp. Silwood2]
MRKKDWNGHNKRIINIEESDLLLSLHSPSVFFFYFYKLSSSCPCEECGGTSPAPPAPPPCPYNFVIIGVTTSSSCFFMFF